MSTPQTKRPEFRNINVMDIKNYRLPPAGIVSILHRISGAVMFLALPLLLCIIAAAFGSPERFMVLSDVLVHPVSKIILLGLIWAVLHHACAGVRYLVIDVHIGVNKEEGRKTALSVLAVSLMLTTIVAAKLFNLF